MKIKFIKLLALALCVFMLFTSMTCLSVFAEETSGETSEEELEWEDEWKENKYPAYTSTSFSSVKDRILGSGEIAPMVLLAVIDGYAFYGDTLTGEMIFLRLADTSLTKEQILEEGSIPEYVSFYCTNPYNAGAAKPVGLEQASIAAQKEKLLSQLIIKYSGNSSDSEMTSFADGAANQQIIVKNIRGGVRVEYTIGREEIIYLVPRLIKKEKLEALRDQIAANSLSDRDALVFMSYFVLQDLDDDMLTDKGKQDMIARYPIVEQFPVYVCTTGISAAELSRLEKLVKTYTDYDKNQMDEDHAETDYESEDEVPPLFKLALEYRVDDGEITIRCNAGNIRFDSSSYTLSDVTVLPYGGAGDANNSGYIFSPDGSGSLIDFSDLSSQYTTTFKTYGPDYAYHTITGQNRESVRLPVFGVYQRVENDSKKTEIVEVLDENGDPVYDADGNIVTELIVVDVPLEIAYLAVIEKGDSLATINIAYGGALHNYASIYTSFNPRPKDTYVIDGGISAGTDAMWTVESERKYTGDFLIRLFIIDGTEDGDVSTNNEVAGKSYSDMAAAYRKYLIDTGVLTEVPDLDKDIPLYLETLGALETTKTILGVPVDTLVSLTSFQDTIDILTELREDKNISNVKVKLNGWYNNGLMSNIATSIEIEDILGGEEGFSKLVSYAKENNITLFPDIELGLAYKDKLFDGFDTDEDIAQTIDERKAMLQEYDPVLQGFASSGVGIISASFIKELYASANEDYSKYNVGSISVGTLGAYLSSDFNVDNPINREDSKELVTQLLATIKSNNEKILVTAGNEYTLAYATDILEVPLDDSRLLESYASVPFMSMVLHGYKEYAGSALNLAGDYDYYLLKTIESGASPYFVIAANNTSELKQVADKSSISKYYSVRYSIWKEDIVSAYNAVNDALSDVQDAMMLKHEILTQDGKTVKVVYDNGIAFYINYGEEAYSVEGTDIVVPVDGYVKVNANGETIRVWEGV